MREGGKRGRGIRGVQKRSGGARVQKNQQREHAVYNPETGIWVRIYMIFRLRKAALTC